MAVPGRVIADRWEDIKPTFLRLYHDENKSLVEVRHQLEEKHHFKARSAFTRQIEKWNAFKNYKASDKQLLASQRVEGKQPEVDFQGRPIKWERIYRATQGQRIRKRRPNSRVNASESADGKKIRASAAPLLMQPMDPNCHVIRCVVDIWRYSTVQFASRDPLDPSYNIDYSMYHRLMQSMSTITLWSKSQWPALEINFVCNAIPALVEQQPAMVCDLLNLLTTREPPDVFNKSLRDELFAYVRSMSRKVLRETSPFRMFMSHLDNRAAFNRLGASIAKAKVDTMWNTHVVQAKEAQQERPFFRQVVLNAILVVMDYEELEFAARFLKKLSTYDPEDPFYLAVCTKLADQQARNTDDKG